MELHLTGLAFSVAPPSLHQHSTATEVYRCQKVPTCTYVTALHITIYQLQCYVKINVKGKVQYLL